MEDLLTRVWNEPYLSAFFVIDSLDKSLLPQLATERMVNINHTAISRRYWHNANVDWILAFFLFKRTTGVLIPNISIASCFFLIR
jgi:hypothetical protein